MEKDNNKPPSHGKEDEKREDALETVAIQQVMAPTHTNHNGQQHPVNSFGHGNIPHTPSGRHSAPTLPMGNLGGHNIVCGGLFFQMPMAMPAAAPAPETAKKQKKGKAAAKKPAKAKAGNRGKGGGRENKCNERETQILLTAVEKCLPIGQPAWKAVEDYYNKLRPEGRIERDYKSLKRRYTSLHETMPPTGDPNVPEEVLEAKRIEELIIRHSSSIAAGNVDEGSNEIVIDDDSSEASHDSWNTLKRKLREDNLKTTGLSDEDEEKVEEKAEEKAEESKEEEAKKRKPGRPKNSKNKAKKVEECSERDGGTKDLIAAMIATTSKFEAKRERAKERRRDKRENRNMKLPFGMLGAAINAWAPRNADELDVQAVTELLDSPSSCSSIDSQDSPGAVKEKEKKGKKRKRLN